MTARGAHLYEQLAELLGYPSGSLVGAAERCRAAIAGQSPAAAEALATFAADVAGLGPSELEELYARTFDLNQTRCLDLGYQLFGETYKRGSFLVKMKEAVSAHGVSAGVELPDHLPVVLCLLPRLAEGEEPRELVGEVVLPVVEKLIRTFTDEDGGYRALLQAIKFVLMADYGIAKVAPPPALAAERGGPEGGKRLPMFPGFNPPSERHLS